ncbi:MAG: hypothetical protein RIB46_07125 [Pseudomonadales bacterium]
MKVLAISSGGGHWIELLRLLPALEQHQVSFACVRDDYQADIGSAPFFRVQDATQWNPFGLLLLAAQVLLLIARLRPDVVISTGAAPGYFALRIAKLFGGKTIWVDSLANVEQLSRSGIMVKRYADLYLTQWPNLAIDGGPEYAGKVL